jgi:hypothetical protein
MLGEPNATPPVCVDLAVGAVLVGSWAGLPGTRPAAQVGAMLPGSAGEIETGAKNSEAYIVRLANARGVEWLNRLFRGTSRWRDVDVWPSGVTRKPPACASPPASPPAPQVGATLPGSGSYPAPKPVAAATAPSPSHATRKRDRTQTRGGRRATAQV